MEGKNVLVTGATSGIGFSTAGAVAEKGARVIVTGRDEERGCEAVLELRRRAGHDRIEFLPAEHSTVRGNRRLAERVAGTADRLDVLVNNVGGLYAERRETEDGYEATLATNFLGPFSLTDALMPLLRGSAVRAGSPVRVVNVASAAHKMLKGGPFEDLEMRGKYVGFDAYARSKLLNVLWTPALARRLEGSGVVANATNPGMAWTAQTNPLTTREREALSASADGTTVEDVAEVLYLSEGTVRNYLSTAIKKLGARNRVEAARLAERRGWL